MYRSLYAFVVSVLKFNKEIFDVAKYWMSKKNCIKNLGTFFEQMFCKY